MNREIDNSYSDVHKNANVRSRRSKRNDKDEIRNNPEQNEWVVSEPGGDSESDHSDDPFKIVLLHGVHTTFWRETEDSALFQPNPSCLTFRIVNDEYQAFRTNSTLRNREVSSFV